MSETKFDRVIRGDVVTADAVIGDAFVAVRDGTIAAVGTGPVPAADRVDDHRGCLLFPGLVDAQVHSGSFEGLAGLRDATRAAAAGGVTTIVDMPFDEPLPVNDVGTLDAKIATVRELASVDVALYVTARKDRDYAQLSVMAERGACGIKLSTYEYHPVRFPRFDTGEMYEIFREAARIGLPVAFHNEDQELVNHFLGKVLARGDRSPGAHGASRPPVAELVANAQILELAAHAGVRCHIVHCSLAAGFDMARNYRERDARITAETCLQYLIFNEADMIGQGAFLRQNPPLRSEAERLRLWDSLERGDVDLLSTDHVAWPVERKSDPDIFKNGAGVPGLETLLPVFYTALAQRSLSPCIIARVCAQNPARHFGFARKGEIRPGADADIAVLRRGASTFDQSRMASWIKWSPYHGRALAGHVTATYLRGEMIFGNGAVLAKAGYGRFVTPAGAALSLP
jgi:allantoinase